MTTPEQHRTPRSSRAAAEAPTGMLQIGRSPVRAGLHWVVLAAVVGASLFAWATADVVGEAALSFPVAFVGWAVLIGGGIATVLTCYYRPVAFDPAGGLARLGRDTVPLAKVTAARREVSAGVTSTYLRYRFAASNGAWGRVLVAGRPIRGLRPEDRQRLEQFIVASAIADPPAPDDLPPAQQATADAIGVGSVTQLQTYAANRPAGKAELLAELRGEIPEPAVGEVDLPPVDTLREQWIRDDREAESVVLRSAADTVRRMFGWLVAATVAAGLAGIAVAAILEESSATGRLDPETNSAVGAFVLLAAATAFVSYLGYAVAGFASARYAQRAVLAWAGGRDDQQVARGIPPRLLVPFLGPPPAHRLRMAGGFAGAVVGGTGLLAGVVAAVAVPEPPAVAAAGMFLIGLGVLWVGVALFRRARHARGEQHRLAARLGGHRLAQELAGAG